MIGLTRRQADALAFIRTTLAERNVAPSFVEIAAHLGTVKSSVHRLVHGLADRGHIRILPNRERSIELVQERFPAAIEAGLTFLAFSTGRSREQLLTQAVEEMLTRQVRR